MTVDLEWLSTLPVERLETFVATLNHAERAALEADLTELTTGPAGELEQADKVTPAQLAGWATRSTWNPRPHLAAISDAFVQTVTTAGRLIIVVPPQHGKSQIVSRWGAAWYLNRWPDRHVVLVSYGEALARARSREVRELFASGRMTANLQSGVATQAEWETDQGGGMIAVGIQGGLTGKPAHLLIIDDPFKDWEDAHSRASRESVWNWWRAVATPRLHPDAAVVVVMTRWHEDDLVGRLLSDDFEGDSADWRMLRIPALSEGNGDPLGRPEGMPLIRPDVEHTQEQAGVWLEKQRRALGPYLWNGLYQGRPGAAQGTIILRGWWQVYSGTPMQGTITAGDDVLEVARMRVVQSWDMAFKDKASSSFVVGQVWGTHPSRPADRFLLDQVRDRLGFSATKKAVVAMRERWPSTSVTLVEDKANGPAIIDELRRVISGLTPVTPEGSKEARAWSCQGDVEAGNVWIPSQGVAPWVAGFVDELADFPNGTHDDQVDAFSQALLRLRQQRPVRLFSAAAQRLP